MAPFEIDHLVFAAADLERGIERLEAATGFEVVDGGRHPKFGTRNGIVTLAGGVYIEVIGPDPDREAHGPVELFGIRQAEPPGLATWAARGEDLEAVARSVRSEGVDLGQVSAASREQSDGAVLRWRLSDPLADRCSGVVPFLIDWGDTAHPTRRGPVQGSLTALEISHPEPERVRGALTVLGLDLRVESGRAGLTARLETPRGSIRLV